VTGPARLVAREHFYDRTFRDPLWRKRLRLKMLQREVAEQIGVNKASVFNWEAGTSNPFAAALHHAYWPTA
jgi:transcriptional regulator with XRE-family HTH domain